PVPMGGREVRGMPLEGPRGRVGFGPQGPFLFSDTVGDNVAFGLDGDWAGDAGAPVRRAALSGLPDAGLKGPRHERGDEVGTAGDERMKRIVAASAIPRLDKDVPHFPKGYHTLVRQPGLTPSRRPTQPTAT